jgi:hypothetical protein
MRIRRAADKPKQKKSLKRTSFALLATASIDIVLK